MCIGIGNGTFVIAELVEALDRGMVEDEEEDEGGVGEVEGMVWERGGESGEAKGKKVLLKLSLL
jgi:methionine salvage enolase-phosphatase E1